MPPTIQTNENAPDKTRTQKTVATEKKSDLVCKVKYSNNLPDIPFDLKFIAYPFESLRFIQYNPTSLERNYRYEVLTEHDMGVTIDLIDKDAYNCEFGAQLDPADEKLLEEDILTPQDSKRSRHHARNVSWLRRTEYISTEQTRFQPQTMDKVEAKVGYSIKKSFKDETLYMDRDSQIKAIEKTFVDAKLDITKHYSKPGVYPVEVLPIFPDFKLWKYPCAQVIFDNDPAPVGKNVPAQIEEMSQAMIRGVMDESGAQFVAYFLPCEETLEKRKRDFADGVPYKDDEEYEYKMAREYNWNVKSKASKGYEENYFFVIRDEGVYFNELETRVRLSKRRQKVGQSVNNTRLIVKHRSLNANEFRMQRFREKQLEPPNEDDEDEEEPIDDEPMDVVHDTNPSDNESRKSKSRSKSPSSRASSVGSRQSKSRSEKSRSRSASSRASNRSASVASNRSGSRASNRSGSHVSNRSGSQTSKRSGSHASQRSGSQTSKRSGSAASKRSGSAASKRSGSVASKRSGSAASKRSGSAASKRSGSASNRSESPASNRSGSPASNRSGSPASNRSGSPASNRSASPASNRSRSPASGSRASSPAGSPRSSKSRSGSRHSSGRRSASKSGSRASSVGSRQSGSRSPSPKSSAASSRSASGSRSNSP